MSKYVCGGGCGKHVIRPEGPLNYCTVCFWLDKTLRSERCSTVHELRVVRERAEFRRARIADILRRSGVDDADDLIASLSR